MHGSAPATRTPAWLETHHRCEPGATREGCRREAGAIVGGTLAVRRSIRPWFPVSRTSPARGHAGALASARVAPPDTQAVRFAAGLHGRYLLAIDLGRDHRRGIPRARASLRPPLGSLLGPRLPRGRRPPARRPHDHQHRARPVQPALAFRERPGPRAHRGGRGPGVARGDGHLLRGCLDRRHRLGRRVPAFVLAGRGAPEPRHPGRGPLRDPGGIGDGARRESAPLRPTGAAPRCSTGPARPA